jgi:hypothetical protein
MIGSAHIAIMMGVKSQVLNGAQKSALGQLLLVNSYGIEQSNSDVE